MSHPIWLTAKIAHHTTFLYDVTSYILVISLSVPFETSILMAKVDPYLDGIIHVKKITFFPWIDWIYEWRLNVFLKKIFCVCLDFFCDFYSRKDRSCTRTCFYFLGKHTHLETLYDSFFVWTTFNNKTFQRLSHLCLWCFSNKFLSWNIKKI